MFIVLRANTYISESILTFVWLCHKYSDICMNMSQISSTYLWVFQFKPDYISVKYVRMTYNIFTTCVGFVLVVHEIIPSNTLIGCLSRLQVCQPSDTLLSIYLVLPFAIQAVLFWNNYRISFHLHEHQGWYYDNDVIEIPAVLSWSNLWSCPKWDIIPQNLPDLWSYKWWNNIWYWYGESDC